MKDKTFGIHDCTFSIWREMPVVGDAIRDRVMAETHEFYNEIRFWMMNSGWTSHQDPQVKKHYRSIANTHHEGRRGDIHFKSQFAGRHIEVKFFEDEVRDHPAGGFYTYDKLRKMPYLRRLRAQLAIRQLRDFLLSNGYSDESKVYPEDGLAAIMTHRAELEDFQGKDFYARERQSYNVIDGDGKEMFDGDVRYFWDWHGNLVRGQVYRHINNMWWIHTGPFSYSNIAAFDLFTWTPEMGRRRPLPAAKLKEKLTVALDRAVKNFDSARAAALLDLLKPLSAPQVTSASAA